MAFGDVPKEADNNPDLNAMLDSLAQAGMAVTNTWKDMWLTALQYTWGQMLRDIRPKENWNYIVINRIYPLLFQNIAKLSKNNPKIITHGWDEEKEGVTAFVEQWAGILQYIWESKRELSMRLKLIKGLLDAGLFGYMVGKTYWDDRVKFDDDSKKWAGNVRHTFVHPALFWCDPAAETVEAAENLGTKRRVKLEWAKNKWPEHKDDIETQAYAADDPRFIADSDIIYSSQKGDTLERNGTIFTKIVQLVTGKGLGNAEQAGGKTDDKERYVDIEEIYWKDYSEKKIKIEEPLGVGELEASGKYIVEGSTGLVFDTATKKPVEKEDWPKKVIKEFTEPNFPNGRFVLRVGKTILNPEDDDQKYAYDMWPFQVMPYHILPHMWQGGNAVEMVRNNNDMLNLTMSAMVNQLVRTADPEKLVEAGTMAKDRKGRIRKVKFGLGKLIVVAKGKIDRIKNMVYPTMDPVVLNLAAFMQKDIDDNSFSQPVSRGEIQKGSTTKAEAIRANVNSHDYTALQAVFLDGWIESTATLIAEIVQANYSPERMIRIKGNDGDRASKMTSQLLDVEFDVSIEAGSTLPFDEERKQTAYLTAYKLVGEPIPNPMIEETLRTLNIADRQKILAKYQGLVLFKQFIGFGQLATQLNPEVLQGMPPELIPLLELLLQAGKLAPQTGISQGAA